MTGWAIRLPGGDWLDVPPGLQIGFELNNTVFSSSDTSVLPGSYSFPVTLPYTPTNRRLLQHPDIVTNPNGLRSLAGVWVYAAGRPMFFGTLQLRTAGKSGLQITVQADHFAPFKTTNLNELDLGGERTWATNDTDRRLHMNETAENPESYDYVFAQIINRQFLGTFTDTPAEEVSQNYFDESINTFSAAGTAIMPFVKLKYLLSQMFAQLAPGWTFQNDFQTALELARLYLHNVFTLKQAPPTGSTLVLPDVFDLRNHVAAEPCGDFVKKLARLFCLGLFTNPFSRKISLAALRDVVAAPVRHDWTSYTSPDQIIAYEDSDAPQQFCHAQPDSEIFKNYPDIDPADISLTTYQTVFDLSDEILLGSVDDGLYFIETLEQVYRVATRDGSQVLESVGRVRRCVEQSTTGDPLSGAMDVLLSGSLSDANVLAESLLPGNYPEQVDGEWTRTEANNESALFFYRGLQDRYLGGVGEETPLTAVGPWNAGGEAGTYADLTAGGSSVGTAAHSLLWHGDDGLYQKFWKPWFDILDAGKPVSARLRLPVSVLTAFGFEDKVRILNMDYFVRQLTVQQLTPEGFVLVDAELFSVI